MLGRNIATLVTLIVKLALAQPTEIVPAESDRFIRATFTRHTTQGPLRRQISTTISNTVRTYLVNIRIGVSPQVYTLSVDTGSFNTWIDPYCSLCANDHNQTGVPLQASQTTSDESCSAYVDGTSICGSLHTGSLKIGNTTVVEATFSVAKSPTTNGYGLLGLGFSNDPQQSTVLDAMKEQGLIRSRSYSFRLNSKASAAGSLVFGGFDARMSASLATVPMWRGDNTRAKIAVEWSGLLLKDAMGSQMYYQNNISMPVTLDTGFTLSTLPDDIFEVLRSRFNVTMSGSNYYVPCKQPQGNVEFTFETASASTQIRISVPFSELAVPANLRPGGDKGQELCMFGFQPRSAWGAAAEMISFGDTFLRSAYVVVNLDAKTIGLAQASEGSNDCEECIVEI